jgi:hypothetical protein
MVLLKKNHKFLKNIQILLNLIEDHDRGNEGCRKEVLRSIIENEDKEYLDGSKVFKNLIKTL